MVVPGRRRRPGLRDAGLRRRRLRPGFRPHLPLAEGQTPAVDVIFIDNGPQGAAGTRDFGEPFDSS